MKQSVPELMTIEAILLDLDGTLYLGDQLFPETTNFLAFLREQKIPFLCLTNNSSRRASSYVEKLSKLGVCLEEDEVLTSGQATITYLLQQTSWRSAYVLGTHEVIEEFEQGGVHHNATDPECVVITYDTTLTYEKLSIATQLVMSGKPYYATHPDRTCVHEHGLLPDIAATIAGIEAVCHRRPEIIGKPELPMIAAARDRLQIPNGRLAIVGDQLDTDILMAKRQGLFSILVLSGETNQARLDTARIQPDLVLPNIGGLPEILGEHCCR